MDKLYDMDALYLYNDGWRTRVGTIEKVNDKSIRMQFGTKINKMDFYKVHRLTDDEIRIYRGEFIKAISPEISNIQAAIANIKALKSALKISDLVCVDSSKLQLSLDKLEEKLSGLNPGEIVINGERYAFNKYNIDTLELVSGDNNE